MLWHWGAIGTTCDGGAATPSRVTVTAVFTYSLTWVMTPSSVMVQACTHHTKLASSYPSVTTTDPNPTTRSGTKALDGGDDDDDDPVSHGTKWWRWHGGPWNHHSRSGATSPWSVSVSLEFKALYKSLTALLLRSSSSRHACDSEFASFGVLKIE